MHRNLCNNVHMGRVLIAEDDEAIRAMAGTLLRHAGHDVDFAANGAEAIACLEANDYDCILLDLMMPTASGFEVLAWMHRERRGVASRRVIVLTAMATASLTNLTADRVFAVVRKPFDIDELRALVDRCVSAGQSGASAPS
jgi:CheY-like chemotaxis protein